MKHLVTNTQYGFWFGPANVVRICSDDKLGVWFEVQTPKETLQIRVTNTGIIKAGKPDKYK